MVGGPPIFPQFAPPQMWPQQQVQPPVWPQNPPLAAMAPGRGAPPAPKKPAPMPYVPSQAYDAAGLPVGQPRSPSGLRPAPNGFDGNALAANKNTGRGPTYRGVAPESTPLVMPSPEQLGVIGSAGATAPAPAPAGIQLASMPNWTPPVNAAATNIDWNATHARLRQLGVTAFHLDRVNEGFRVTCLLPANREGQTHQIESEGVTEAAAVQFALQRAETFAASR